MRFHPIGSVVTGTFRGAFIAGGNDGVCTYTNPLFVKEFMNGKCQRMARGTPQMYWYENAGEQFPLKIPAVLFGLQGKFFRIAVT